MRHITPGRLTIGSDVIPCLDLQRVTAVIAEQGNHSALLHPTNVAVAGAEVPMLRATMPFGIAFDTFGLGTNDLSAGVVEGVLAQTIAGVIDTNSTHVKYARETGSFACAWIDSFRVQEAGVCMAEVAIAFYSDDGATDPITRTNNVAFPALSAIPEEHGIGIFTLNGSALDGLTGISYQAGISFSAQRVSAQPFITGAVPSGFKPVLDLEFQDADAVLALLGTLGVKIASTTTLTLQKYLNSALTTTDQRTITIANGFVAPMQAGGPHGQHFKGGLQIKGASSNGTTHPFAVA